MSNWVDVDKLAGYGQDTDIASQPQDSVFNGETWRKAGEGLNIAMFGSPENPMAENLTLDETIRNGVSNLADGTINAIKATGANALDMAGGILPLGESNTAKLFGMSDNIRDTIPTSSVGKLFGDIISGGVAGGIAGEAVTKSAGVLNKFRFGGKHGDSPLNLTSTVEALLPGKSVASARKGVAGIDNIKADNISETIIRRAAKGTPTLNTSTDLLGTAYKLGEYALGRNSPYSQELARQAVEVAKTSKIPIEEALNQVLNAWRKKAGGKTFFENVVPKAGVVTGIHTTTD